MTQSFSIKVPPAGRRLGAGTALAAAPPLLTVAAHAWLASALVIAMLSFGIWQAWWLPSLRLTSALLAGTAADER